MCAADRDLLSRIPSAGSAKSCCPATCRRAHQARYAKVARCLETRHARLRIRPLSRNYQALKIQNNLSRNMGVDMIVPIASSAGLHLRLGSVRRIRVSHLVIDEADSLLDKSFSPETSRIV